MVSRPVSVRWRGHHVEARVYVPAWRSEDDVPEVVDVTIDGEPLGDITVADLLSLHDALMSAADCERAWAGSDAAYDRWRDER